MRVPAHPASGSGGPNSSKKAARVATSRRRFAPRRGRLHGTQASRCVPMLRSKFGIFFKARFERDFGSRNFLIVSNLQQNAEPPKLCVESLLRSGDMVGASGFEPEASCAQGRLASFHNSFQFTHSIESSRLRKRPSMCAGVRGCSHLIVRSLQKSLQSSVADAGVQP